MTLPLERLSELLRVFPTRRIAVVGDLMLDRFIYGDVERISPEAPVPIVDVARQELRLGGAGNVISNLVALGCRVGHKQLHVAKGSRMLEHVSCTPFGECGREAGGRR